MSIARKPIAHDKVLTEEDQAQFRLKSAILERIEQLGSKRGLQPGEMRILDWGCGRGRTVFHLRELGYQAFGVDVDPMPIENGRHLARERGLDAERVLSTLDPQGRTRHPSGFFHFICSDQVLEHVANLTAAAREIARLTANGGGGVHIYPGRHRSLEGHLMMPFVHWLPKNRSRLWLIHLLVRLGIEAELKAYEGLNPSERARKFYKYTLDNTFYRNSRAVRRAFEAAGLTVAFDTVHGPSTRRLAGPLVDYPIVAPMLNALLVRFLAVHLVLGKPVTPESGPG